jgi:hypothetical protein
LRWRTPLQAMGFVRATAPNLNFSPNRRYFLSKQNVNNISKNNVKMLIFRLAVFFLGSKFTS